MKQERIAHARFRHSQTQIKEREVIKPTLGYRDSYPTSLPWEGRERGKPTQAEKGSPFTVKLKLQSFPLGMCVVCTLAQPRL